MSVWLFILHLLNQASLLQTFDIKCPDSSQWQFKEKGFCNRSVPHYYCLLDDNTHALTEFCRNGSEFLRPGYKLVVSGALTGKLCGGDFFQPFKFWTNYSSECALTKSNCGEEGQNNFNNGSSTSDRACRCDHTKGYAFVRKPDNDCFCHPSYEDCSCYFRSCESDYVLTPDYQCVKTSNWTGNYKCAKTGKETTRTTLQAESQLSSMLDRGFWCQHLDAKDTYQRSSQKKHIQIFVFIVYTAIVAMCVAIVLLVVQFPNWLNVLSIDMKRKTESSPRDSFRRRIKANYYDIITTIDYEAITKYMISKNILRKEDLHIISFKGIRRKDKNQELLQKLWRGSQAWFDHFIQALQIHGYSTLANQILETHVDLCDEFDQDLSDDDDGNKNIPQYNRELNTKYIHDWLDEDKRFSQTTASKKLEEQIKENNCILVVGDSGEGKTSLIRHLAVKLWLEEDYDIVPIVMVPLIIRNFYNADRKQVFVVDEFCGRDTINRTSVDLWVLPHYTTLFDDIIEAKIRLDKKDIAKKNIKILIACDSAVYNDPSFRMLDFYKQYTFSLSKWPLSDNEREIMIKNKLFHANMIDSIKGLSFPLLCKLSKGKSNDQIRKFFERPIEWITIDINKIKEQQRYQFFLISLLVILDNQLNVNWLDAQTLPEEKKRSVVGIFKLLFLNLWDKTVKAELEKNLDILEKTFVVRSEKTCSFVHNKIYDISAVICGEYFFCHFVKHASSMFIAERYKLETIHNETAEKEMLISIKTENETLYFDRLINDLENGDTCSFFHNRQLEDKMYRKQFLKYCREHHIFIRIKDCISNLKARQNNNACQRDRNISITDRKNYDHDSFYIELKEKRSHDISSLGKPLIESVIEGYADIVDFALEVGCDINGTHTFGRSSIYFAALLNHIDIMKLLIERKADISVRDHKGRSALYVCCKKGHEQIVDVLLQTNLDISQCDDKKRTPLHAASKKGHEHVVKLLLDKKHAVDLLDIEKHTPLFLASGRGHTETVRKLIQAGSSISIKDKNGWTPLFAACKSGRKAVAELLIEMKASISECDENGRSPLLIASSNGRDEVVKLLIQNKADISKCDIKSRSAVYIACKGGHKTTVNILLHNHCSVNVCNKKGNSPLHVACDKRNLEIVKVLLSYNPSDETLECKNQAVYYVRHEHDKLEAIASSFENKQNINIFNAEGDSPLHVACKRGDQEIATMLVKNGADINHSNDVGKQPLHIACSDDHYEIVDMLLSKSAVIDGRDKEGTTPLIAASKNGRAKIIRLLLEKGAVPTTFDRKKRSPLHFACIQGFEEIVHTLLDKAPLLVSEKDIAGKTALDFANENGHSNIVQFLSK